MVLGRPPVRIRYDRLAGRVRVARPAPVRAILPGHLAAGLGGADRDESIVDSGGRREAAVYVPREIVEQLVSPAHLHAAEVEVRLQPDTIAMRPMVSKLRVERND